MPKNINYIEDKQEIFDLIDSLSVNGLFTHNINYNWQCKLLSDPLLKLSTIEYSELPVCLQNTCLPGDNVFYITSFDYARKEFLAEEEDWRLTKEISTKILNDLQQQGSLHITTGFKIKRKTSKNHELTRYDYYVILNRNHEIHDVIRVLPREYLYSSTHTKVRLAVSSRTGKLLALKIYIAKHEVFRKSPLCSIDAERLSLHAQKKLYGIINRIGSHIPTVTEQKTSTEKAVTCMPYYAGNTLEQQITSAHITSLQQKICLIQMAIEIYKLQKHNVAHLDINLHNFIHDKVESDLGMAKINLIGFGNSRQSSFSLRMSEDIYSFGNLLKHAYNTQEFFVEWMLHNNHTLRPPIKDVIFLLTKNIINDHQLKQEELLFLVTLAMQYDEINYDFLRDSILHIDKTFHKLNLEQQSSLLLHQCHRIQRLLLKGKISDYLYSSFLQLKHAQLMRSLIAAQQEIPSRGCLYLLFHPAEKNLLQQQTRLHEQIEQNLTLAEQILSSLLTTKQKIKILETFQQKCIPIAEKYEIPVILALSSPFTYRPSIPSPFVATVNHEVSPDTDIDSLEMSPQDLSSIQLPSLPTCQNKRSQSSTDILSPSSMPIATYRILKPPTRMVLRPRQTSVIPISSETICHHSENFKQHHRLLSSSSANSSIPQTSSVGSLKDFSPRETEPLVTLQNAHLQTSTKTPPPSCIPILPYNRSASFKRFAYRQKETVMNSAMPPGHLSKQERMLQPHPRTLSSSSAELSILQDSSLSRQEKLSPLDTTSQFSIDTERDELSPKNMSPIEITTPQQPDDSLPPHQYMVVSSSIPRSDRGSHVKLACPDKKRKGSVLPISTEAEQNCCNVFVPPRFAKSSSVSSNLLQDNNSERRILSTNSTTQERAQSTTSDLTSCTGPLLATAYTNFINLSRLESTSTNTPENTPQACHNNLSNQLRM